MNELYIIGFFLTLFLVNFLVYRYLLFLSKNFALSKRNEELVSVNNSLTGKLSAAEFSISSLETQVAEESENRRRALSRLNNKKAESQRSESYFKQQINVVTEQLKNLQTINEELVSHNEELSSYISSAELVISSFKSKEDEISKGRKDIIARLKKKTAESSQSEAFFKEQLELLRRKFYHLQNVNGELSDELKKEKEKNNKLSERVSYFFSEKNKSAAVDGEGRSVSKPSTTLDGKIITDPLYYGPLEDIEMSVRLYNCLKANRINSLHEIEMNGYSDRDLLKARNFGKKSLAELKSILSSLQSVEEEE